MISDRVLRQLLEAEPAELRGEGETDIARIVRRDPDVRAHATQILEALRAVGAGLATASRERAARIPLRGDAAPERSVARPTLPGSAFAWRFAFGLGSCAAAVIMALVLWQQRSAPAQPDGAGSRSITATLDASASRPFAVFATDNPDIAIVWLFDREER